MERAMLCGWVSDYLRACYPRQTALMGQRTVNELVSGAVERARLRGYESSDYVLQYAHATFLLGSDIETAPTLGWARQILDDPDVPVPGERLAVLEEAILRRLEGSPDEANR